MPEHADLGTFPATLEGRGSVGHQPEIGPDIGRESVGTSVGKTHVAGRFGSTVRGDRFGPPIQGAIGQCVKKALAQHEVEGSGWASSSTAVPPRRFERWVPDDSGEFVLADDGRSPPEDPLAVFRERTRTVLERRDDHEVVEYRDGWGNIERAVEWLAGVTPPVPTWLQPKREVSRPTVPRAALGKIANSVSKSKKNETWLLSCRARPWQRPRTAKCRLRRVGNQSVQVTSDGTAVSLCGVETCASVWACPVCAQAIYTERAEEVTTAAKRWRERGPTYVVAMVTTTIRHQRCDDLKWLRRGVSNAWRAMWSGRRAKLLKAELGIVHSVRALEVMHGNNGWHPHLHTLVFLKFRTPPASEEVWTEEQLSTLRNRWIDAVEKTLGVGALPNWERGLDVRISHKDDYIAKLGLEIASIVGKQGRLRGHRTPWQLLRAATNGDVPAQHLWRHYAESMAGARQLTWSRGAKKAFGIAEKSDQEIAEAREEEANKPKVGFTICGWLWDSLVKVPGWLPAFIQAVKEDPARAATMLPPTDSSIDKRTWYQFDRGG